MSYFLVGQNLGLAMPLCLVGALGGLVLVLVATFGRKQDNPAIVLSYAAFEGLFLGAFSFVVANFMVSGISAGALIVQAIIGTLGVFAGMLVVYKTGAIRVTPKFTRFIVAAMFGVVALMLVNLVLAIFGVGGGEGPLRSGGPMAIIFSLRLHRHRGVQLPARLRPGRPGDPRGRAGEGRVGHRPRPDRHAGLALHSRSCGCSAFQQRLAASAKSPARYRAGLFLCVRCGECGC